MAVHFYCNPLYTEANVEEEPDRAWFDYNYSFVGELFNEFKDNKSEVETFSQIYYVGSKTIGVAYEGNGKREVLDGEIDTCPVIKDGSTYIPARYLVEMIGYDVKWDGVTKHISINMIKP